MEASALKTSTILPVSLVLALSPACGGGGGSVSPPATATPAGRFAFVANTMDNTLSSYSVVPGTGMLRLNGFVGARVGQIAPQEVVAHPTGPWVYTPNLGNSANGANISVYCIDPDTGQTEALVPAGIGSGPFDMVFGAKGEYAYVSAAGSDAVWTYAVHPQSGQLSLIGNPITDGFDPTSISLGADGLHLFVTYRESKLIVTYDINPVNGRLSRSVAPYESGNGVPEFVVADPAGDCLFACYSSPDRLVQLLVDEDTGALEAIASRPLGARCTALAVHPGGGWLVIARETGSVRVFGVEPVSRILFLADDDIAAGVDPVDIAFDATARFVYVTNSGSNEVGIYEIDLVTGKLLLRETVRTRSNPGALSMTSTSTRARSFVPRFLYVANEGSDTVTGYQVSGVGALAELSGGGVLTGLSPRSMAVDPLGRFLYTVNVNSPSVSAFRIDPNSGQLTSAGLPLPYTGQPRSIAVAPSGRFAFVANAIGSVEAFGIDQATGELDFRGTTPSGGQVPDVIAVDLTGQFIYVANHGSNDVTALRYDQGFLTGGSFQIVSRVTTYVAGAVTSIRFAPDGRRAYLTVPGIADQVLPMNIDPVNGGLTIGPSGPVDGDEPTSVAVHPDGGFAYAAFNGGAGMLRAFRVEKATGTLLDAVTYPSGMNPIDLRIDPGGNFLYVVNEEDHDISLFKIDAASGALEGRGRFATDASPASLGLTGVLR